MTTARQNAALTEAEVAILQECLKGLEPDTDGAAARFYERLFEIEPELRGMFSEDMVSQGQKFMATLGMIASSFGDEERLLPHLRRLAEGHKAYGVKPEHFRPMGQALVETLKAELGDDMPPGASDLWRRVYDRLAGEMIALGSGG